MAGGWRFRITFALTLAVIAPVLSTSVGPTAGAQADGAYDVTIRRDQFGVPHVTGPDFPSLAYGIGYAFAQDNICTLMDYTATVSAERSRWFGPDATWTFEGNGTTNKNIDSDFFYESVNASGVIEGLIAQEPPHGPLPEIRASVTAYAAGINRYLTDVGGAGGVTDPRCHGAPWVRPLTEIDVYRRFFQLASMASSGVAITGIAQAQPPIGGLVPVIPNVTDDLADQLAAVEQLPARLSTALGVGSNAVALGGDATDNGRGMVLGNPHFPWQGGERLYQMHLTVPGRANVSGAGLYGVPLVLIGHTDGVAWSHTVSTAYRFTPYELVLVPGDPTSYLVDGVPERMRRQDLEVEVLRPDGSVGTEQRTLWSSRYGPMLNSLLRLPLFPWTPLKAYALADANVQMRYLNQFFLWNQAQSVDELFAIEAEHLSVPWVNTIAADREGNALYSDVSVVPHVTDEKAVRCAGVLGLVTFTVLGLPTLDGSRSECAWGSDDDAPVPGIFGVGNLPHVVRRDYVTNSNDSYWLSNPAQPLEGFARIIGDERTTRSLRTRLGLTMVQEGLAGGGTFSQHDLQALVFNDRNGAAELALDAVVALCNSSGGRAPTRAGTLVEVGDACAVLAAWDRRDDLDSPGAVLFRRFWTRLTTTLLPIDVLGVVEEHVDPELLGALPISLVQPEGAPWRVAFDPSDPVATPHSLDTDNPRVLLALGDAVADLRTAGIPLDGTLGDWQYEVKGGQVIPIHGGPHGAGVFNVITARWNGRAGPRAGYSDVVHGSSFVMVAHFVDPEGNEGCGVDADAIVTYSQSEDVTSPWFANQTWMYSRHEWNPMYFCESELLASPGLQITELRGDAAPASAAAVEGQPSTAPAAPAVAAPPATDTATPTGRPDDGALSRTGTRVPELVAVAALLVAYGLHLRLRRRPSLAARPGWFRVSRQRTRSTRALVALTQAPLDLAPPTGFEPVSPP